METLKGKSPEQPKQTPAEAPKGFLGKMRHNLETAGIVAGIGTAVVASTHEAGIDLLGNINPNVKAAVGSAAVAGATLAVERLRGKNYSLRWKKNHK
jgi:hypothetical protein